MTTGRTVHGLAGLIVSDDSGSESDDSGTLAQRNEGKSVFDVPGIFNAEITRKLREGKRAQLQTAAAVIADEEIEVTEVTQFPNRIDINSSPSTRRSRQRQRILHAPRRRPHEHPNYSYILESSNDEDEGSPPVCHSDVSDIDRLSVSDKNGAGDCGKAFTSVETPHAAEESDLDLDISCRTDPDDEIDEEIYRIVVTQIGNDETLVIVRLTERDLMEKVFTEAVSAAGKGGILMMGADECRREVLAEDTVKSLGLSAVGVARMEFVPIQGNRGKRTSSPAFTIKFINGKRRETKEISCKSDEPLGAIFNRYCDAMGVERSSVIFKFDDEVVEDGGTPAGLDIDSGDLVEAHFQKENMTPSGVETGGVGTTPGRPQRKRFRQSYCY